MTIDLIICAGILIAIGWLFARALKRAGQYGKDEDACLAELWGCEPEEDRREPVRSSDRGDFMDIIYRAPERRAS